MIGEDTVKHTRAHRVKSWGHLKRMEQTKTVRKIIEWNPIGMRSTRFPKNSWKDEVMKDVNNLKVRNWPCHVKDRRAWYEQMQEAETHKGL
jgi:hypothetical protein